MNFKIYQTIMTILLILSALNLIFLLINIAK